MFENPTDRSTFWHCANGINYLKNCPSPLVWSQAIQACTWNVEEPSTTIAPTIASTDIVSTTITTPSSLPPQCLNYTSITDGTRRTTNTYILAETDNTYFSKTRTWVRFEGDAGTRIAESTVPSNRCGSEGAGWLKHPQEPEIGETVTQTACFNMLGMSCIWPVKIPMTNCDGFFVYGLVAPAPSNARYCTI
ncbi:unnamed protein product [Adineta steineri]|uniref:Chitin-binding type-2 domain-containing protein n=1 Tax=Adineta steineri TaxID=433720 RepID=A0A815BSR9_9BILA|nr:unnamed protein product [Adineta steineri]CAF1273947.1 unnamed protein product [Adineta steineri]